MIRHRKYQKGEALIIEEQASDTLYIIKSGHVKLLKMTPQGKEQILHILTTGDFFGELNIFNSDELSNFSAYALKDTDICMLTKDDMEQLIRNNPDISLKLLKTITKRLAHTENLAQSLATKDPEIRIAYMILELGHKYGKPDGSNIKINLPFHAKKWLIMWVSPAKPSAVNLENLNSWGLFIARVHERLPSAMYKN